MFYFSLDALYLTVGEERFLAAWGPRGLNAVQGWGFGGGGERRGGLMLGGGVVGRELNL